MSWIDKVKMSLGLCPLQFGRQSRSISMLRDVIPALVQICFWGWANFATVAGVFDSEKEAAPWMFQLIYSTLCEFNPVFFEGVILLVLVFTPLLLFVNWYYHVPQRQMSLIWLFLIHQAYFKLRAFFIFGISFYFSGALFREVFADVISVEVALGYLVYMLATVTISHIVFRKAAMLAYSARKPGFIV